jgi:putative transposase
MHVEDRHGLDELRRLARSEGNARMRIRLLSVVLAKQGRTSVEIAQTLDAGRRSVQTWIQRYNQEGIDGLAHRPGQGRPWRLSLAQRERLCVRLDDGVREDDGVCTLRGKDFQRILQQEFGQLYHLNGVYKLLHRLGYSCLMPRPQHRQADPLAQEAFKKNSPSNWRRSAPLIRRKRSKSGSKTRPVSVSRAR